MDSERLLKPAEAAAQLETTVRTLARWADQGLIAAVTLPTGHRRYPAAAVSAIANAHNEALAS